MANASASSCALASSASSRAAPAPGATLGFGKKLARARACWSAATTTATARAHTSVVACSVSDHNNRETLRRAFLGNAAAAVLLLGGMVDPVFAEEGVLSNTPEQDEAEMMLQFRECIRNTCDAELIACGDDDKCLGELGCLQRCSVMRIPSLPESMPPVRLPDNKARIFTRRLADELIKDSIEAEKRVAKAFTDYETPAKGFPGGILGI